MQTIRDQFVHRANFTDRYVRSIEIFSLAMDKNGTYLIISSYLRREKLIFANLSSHRFQLFVMLYF